MTSIRTACCLLALLVLTSACAGSGTDTSAADASDSASAPFDAILIELFGTDDTEQYLVTAEQSAAELVAACMSDAGFEFQIPDVREELEPLDPTSVDDALANGFGIISGYLHSVSQTSAETDFALDPNIAYLGSLSPGEANRFLLTLNGPDAEPGQRKDDAGCNGEASDVAYADWVRFSSVLANFTAMGEERDTHPDWLTARTEWRDCMVARGFDYAEPEVIRTNVTTRMRTTVAESYPGGQLPLVLVGDEFMVAPQVAELLEELAVFERMAAVANVECTEPLLDRFDAVEYLVQEQFVERNRVAIDELLEANT